MSHEEVAELLGAFALDAVDADEAAAVRAHLATCPRCAAEVAEHREVAGLIANAGVDAPPELWERIAERIDDTGAGALRPPPVLVPPPTRRGGAPGTARRRVLAWAGAGVAAAAAVAAVAVLGVQVSRVDGRVDQMAQAAQRSGLSGAVAAALLDPSARRVTLTSSAGSGRAAVLVILPDGSAFALNTGMPSLPPDRTYQLWGFVGGRPVSLGVLGNHPGQVAFTVDPDAVVTTFAVTTEAAGGAVRPTHAPVALSTTA